MMSSSQTGVVMRGEGCSYHDLRTRGRRPRAEVIPVHQGQVRHFRCWVPRFIHALKELGFSVRPITRRLYRFAPAKIDVTMLHKITPCALLSRSDKTLWVADLVWFPKFSPSSLILHLAITHPMVSRFQNCVRRSTEYMVLRDLRASFGQHR